MMFYDSLSLLLWYFNFIYLFSYLFSGCLYSSEVLFCCAFVVLTLKYLAFSLCYSYLFVFVQTFFAYHSPFRLNCFHMLAADFYFGSNMELIGMVILINSFFVYQLTPMCG